MRLRPLFIMDHPNLHPDILAKINKSDKDGGIFIDQQKPGTVLTVTTQNNTYKIVVIKVNKSQLNVTIQGGKYFPEETKVFIRGSIWDGSMLKNSWVGIAMYMDIWIPILKKSITTSAVKTIKIVGNGYNYTLPQEES